MGLTRLRPRLAPLVVFLVARMTSTARPTVFGARVGTVDTDPPPGGSDDLGMTVLGVSAILTRPPSSSKARSRPSSGVRAEALRVKAVADAVQMRFARRAASALAVPGISARADDRRPSRDEGTTAGRSSPLDPRSGAGTEARPPPPRAPSLGTPPSRARVVSTPLPRLASPARPVPRRRHGVVARHRHPGKSRGTSRRRGGGRAAPRALPPTPTTPPRFPNPPASPSRAPHPRPNANPGAPPRAPRRARHGRGRGGGGRRRGSARRARATKPPKVDPATAAAEDASRRASVAAAAAAAAAAFAPRVK